MNEKTKLTPETNPEEVRTFELYEKDLGISLESMAGKSILDVGCGTNASFLKYCIKRGIDIVGMDARLPDEKDKEIVKGHYIQGNILKPPIVENKFDLVLSRALPVPSKHLYKRVILNMLSLLKPGGEFRIAPAFIDTNTNDREAIGALKASQDSLGLEVSVELIEMQETKSGTVPRYLIIIRKNT